MNRAPLAVLLLGAAALSACAVGPDYRKRDTPQRVAKREVS